MDSESWRRLEQAFFDALEIPAEQRAAYLDAVCQGDAAFRAELEAVLAAHEEAGGIRTPDRLLPAFDGQSVTDVPMGTRIGAYRIDSLIGHGGMGEVYLASRADEQYTQQVAIKLVRAGRTSPESVRRFRVERQILARLEHPNIATLLDGGVTESGQPFLVMQYVDGVPITHFADARRLSLTDRLRLFVIVAKTVQFAHTNLIVHRDLKPTNILVGADGQPRLLDFGIAKLLDPSEQTSTTGDILLLTPEHAAPEQFRGKQVTTATDVYSLGVLLYELLTGVRPFQFVPAAELALAVCERDPSPPSVVVRDERATALHGDLDQIILMALRKEPERRYGTAGQFAEDVERYLDGQPVLARPAVFSYRARKFVARNRAAVTAAAFVSLALITATAVSLAASSRSASALRVAERERAKATRLTDFLLGVFNASNPSEAVGRTVTARDLLDRAALTVGRDLAADSAVRGDLQLAIGRAYQGLGLPKQAATLIDSVVLQRRTRANEQPLELAAALEFQARNRLMAGEPPKALALANEALSIRERAQGANAAAVGRTLNQIANISRASDLTDSAGTIRRTLERAITILRAADTVDHREMAQAYRTLGTITMDQNKPADALRYMQSAVVEGEQAVGPDHPFLFNLYENLALGLQSNKLPDSAIAIHRRLLAARARVFGTEHVDYSFSLYNLGRELCRTGKFDEGLPLMRQAITVREKALGPDHYLVSYGLISYATALAQNGDLEGSATSFARAANIAGKALGATSLPRQDALEGVAIARATLKQKGPALDALEALVEAGYRNVERLREAPFPALANEPRFKAVMARASQ